MKEWIREMYEKQQKKAAKKKIHKEQTVVTPDWQDDKAVVYVN